MAVQRRNVRVRAPLMQAFRGPYEEAARRAGDRGAGSVLTGLGASAQPGLAGASSEAMVPGHTEGGQAAPVKVVAGHGLSRAALVDEMTLVRLVRADIERLLNTTNMAATQRLGDWPEVSKSVLNYGIPDLAHRTIDEGALDEVIEEFETAVRIFEPRIPPRSISVRREAAIDSAELRVRFRIAAEVRMAPENLPIEFLAEVEVDSGHVVLKRT